MAESEGTPRTDASPLPPIGEPITLQDYAESFKGNTETAQRHKRGAAALIKRGLADYRHVKGDFYGPLRAALFQTLQQPKHNVQAKIDKLKEKLEKFNTHHKKNYGIHEWSFGGRNIRQEGESVETAARRCVDKLQHLVNLANKAGGTKGKSAAVVEYLNKNTQNDEEVMEGVKILMMLQAIDLYNNVEAASVIPAFTQNMYGREDLNTPQKLFHALDYVGDAQGIEEIELCLLAHTLGVSITVYDILADPTSRQFLTYRNDNNSKPVGQIQIDLLCSDARNYHIIV